MKNNELTRQMEKILDDWDPVGILQDVKPIIYNNENRIGEYSEYVNPIIRTFFENKSVYDYLIILHTKLRDEPGEQIRDEIKLVAVQIKSSIKA